MIDLKQIFRESKNKALLKQALTHRSWVNENPGQRGSNERLEFLGDAVLELTVTDYLYNKFPEKDEGYLTNLRANIVNTINLSKIAKEMKVGEEMYLSKGESLLGKENNSLLADTVEAIIGAIYIDRGFEEASGFILSNLLSDIGEKLKEPLKDAKSILQESMQAKGMPAPKYRIVKTVGPDHDREFTVEVLVAGKVLAQGTGKNKSLAEQNAARLAEEAKIT